MLEESWHRKMHRNNMAQKWHSGGIVTKAFADIFSLFSGMPSADLDRVAELDRGLLALSSVTQADEEGRAWSRWHAMWSKGDVGVISQPVVALFVASYASPDFEIHQASDFVALHSKSGGLASYAATDAGTGLSLFELAPSLPFDPQVEGLGEAMAVATMAYGMEACATGADLLALTCQTFGWQQHGPKLINDILAAKGRDDAEELLAHVIGRDIPALMGAMAAASYERIPTLLEGEQAHLAAHLIYLLVGRLPGQIMSVRRPSWFSHKVPSILAPTNDMLVPAVDAALSVRLLRSKVSMTRDLVGMLDA